MKKAFGFLCIILAGLLILTFVSQIPNILNVASSSTSSTRDIGYTVGTVCYYILHLGVTYALLKYGLKLLKKQRKTSTIA